MVKKKVIGTFIGLILFTGLIFFVQSQTQERVTGYSIGDIGPVAIGQLNLGSTNSFSLKIEHYTFVDNVMNVFYNVQEKYGNNHNLEVTYFVNDAVGNSVQSGKEYVFLEAGKNMDYSLSFKVNGKINSNYYLTLVGEDGFGEQRASVPLEFESSPITGNVVGEHQTTALTYFGVMVVGLIVLFYCLKIMHVNRLRKKLEAYQGNSRFININE